MDSPLPIARPWTPPETDHEASPRSDYFSDPFRPSSQDTDQHWPSDPAELARMPARYDIPADGHNKSRPKPINRLTEPSPHTPVKGLDYGFENATGALRYPYTPDSSRMIRRNTELASSPSPWDEFSDHSVSPVQDALSSCIVHFENLIHSQQPDEDQMEYVIAQFENMTSYLSAPDSQTKRTDDHLFNEPEIGLGITNTEKRSMAKLDMISREVHEAYVTEVGNYIAGVKKYIEDLKMRLDEVKTLNSIQLDVINDLRRQMRSVRQGMRTSLSMRDDMSLVEEELNKLGDSQVSLETSKLSPGKKEFGLDSWETLIPETDEPIQSTAEPSKTSPTTTTTMSKPPHIRFAPGTRVIHIVRKPEPPPSFWRSFGEALDNFSAMLRDDTDTEPDD